METDVQITMLGEFTLETSTQTLSSGENRSRKSRLLLAYLSYYHRRVVPQEELVAQLWGGEDGSTNPANALKTMFHRLRTLLGSMDCFGGVAPLVHRKGGYTWNSRIPISLDTERFDDLCRRAEEAGGTERLNLQYQAAQLYRGDFLSRYASFPWVAATGERYHTKYLALLDEVLPSLERAGLFEEGAALCRSAVAIEPCSEALHGRLMRQLLNLGDQAGAIAVYEEIRKRLYDRSGDMPCEALRNLYHEAMRRINEKALSIAELTEQLCEPPGSGALFCDYDFFRVVYHAYVRDLARSGQIIQLCLITVQGAEGTSLSRRSLDSCMANLKEILCASLRRGDLVTSCSANQYAVLLPRANYENSCRVCERVVKAFYRRCPHTPARLHYAAQPLSPES